MSRSPASLQHGVFPWSEVSARRPLSMSVACALLIPVDLLTILGSAAVAYALWLAPRPHAGLDEYVVVALLAAVLAVNQFYFLRLYDFHMLMRPPSVIRRMLVAWAVVALVLTAVGFLTQTGEQFSRAWAVLWFCIALALLLAWRAGFYLQARRMAARGELAQNVAVVGDGDEANALVLHFAHLPATGVRVLGQFWDADDPGAGVPPGRRSIVDLVDLARRESVDTIIVAPSHRSHDRLGEVIDALRVLPVDVRLLPGHAALNFVGRGVSRCADVPLIDVADRPLADWRWAVKELEDRVLGTLILVLIAPLLLAIAAAIKLDSRGPVLFRQRRYGYNNKIIEVFKFRTMRDDAADADASRLTARGDPRVTRVGALLRRTSLDELPQFLNVVRGEMSIVGPRPHALAARAGGLLYHEAVRNYDARHRVKPGITGLAQINGWRGATDRIEQIRRRVEHDLDYIDNWSLWLDLRIIAITCIKGFTDPNAY